VGPRGLAEGVVELVERSSGESREVSLGDAVATVTDLIAAANRGPGHD
jgi:prolyl-tRNA synthetase